MDRKLAVRLLIAAALFALTAALYYLTRPDTTSPGPTESPGTGTIIPAEQSREDTSAGPADRRGTLEDLRRQLQSGNAGLAELQALRARLLAAPPAEAIAEIEAFLATGQDAALRSDFEVGEGGTLAGAPSLRVFLLDLLGQIARGSGSDAAARIARGVLEKKTSPDEWAIAMRNVAWQEPRSKPYLAAKMREMLAHEPWTTSPSSGLLEAFDVIVYTADPAFIPELSQLRSKGVPDIERAAAVAMDRLSETAPLEVMNYLNSHPAEFADRPLVRADFYAKADLTVPAQRAAVETYLARGDVGLEEKTKLLGGLASPASFVSDALLTPPPTPGDDLARLQNYASVLQQWQQQRRFPQLLGQMQALESRLRAQTR